MDKNKKNNKKEISASVRPSKRRLIQVYAALLYNAHIKGFIEGEIYTGKAKIVCVPGLNCYSCPGAAGACPLGALQNALAYSGKTAGFYILGILLLYGTIFGRTVCGYLCPFGLIQELLNKIPTPKIPKSRLTMALSYLKYIIAAVFVFGITLWFGLKHGMTVPGFCKYICPAGTLEGAVSILSNPNNSSEFAMLGGIFTHKFVMMLVIGLVCIFCYRAFCRFVCPLGAIYGLFNKYNIIGVKIDKNRCNGCGACAAHCGMDVRYVGDRECINCAKCMDVCAQKAISVKAGNVALKTPNGDISVFEKRGIRTKKIAFCTAFAVLAFALAWFNFIDPSVKRDIKTETIGFETGNTLENFEIECFDGKKFSLEAAKGKPVFINLWATYCGPCVKELPIFESFYKAHFGDVELIAVHHSIVDDDPKTIVSESGLTIPFAIDTEDETVWKAVGGTSSMPQTIVLDKNGKVIYNRRGSVDMDLLESLYKEAAK